MRLQKSHAKSMFERHFDLLPQKSEIWTGEFCLTKPDNKKKLEESFSRVAKIYVPRPV